MILLDTSVLSRIFRRRRPGRAERGLEREFRALMASDLPVGLPGIVLQEVLSGVRSGRQFDDLRSRLLAAFVVVPAGVGDHAEAARLKNTCQGKGLNVSGIDCLIAVCAMAGVHELFTLDEDFEAIAKHAPLQLYKSGSLA